MTRENIREKFDKCLKEINMTNIYTLSFDEDEIADFYIDDVGYFHFFEVKTKYRIENMLSIRYKKQYEEIIGKQIDYIEFKFDNDDSLVVGMHNYHCYFQAKLDGENYGNFDKIKEQLAKLAQ